MTENIEHNINQEMSRLVIGTAQFGSPYGISNQRGQVDVSEVKSILELTWKSGIRTIDTASSYGNSEEVLGLLASAEFQIIGKLKSLPATCESVGTWVCDQLQSSLQNLKRSSIYALLVHNPADLSGAQGEELFESLLVLKENGIVEKLGISIYSPTELDSLIPRFEFDIVQTPLNVLDNSIHSSGWLSKLSDMGVSVHARSVFLQGLLLQKSSDRSQTFSKWKTILGGYDSWVQSLGVTSLQACLAHVMSYEQVSNIVFGVTSRAELCEIISSLPTDPIRAPANLYSTDVELVNPMNWKSR
jgi:aryl-alcohol dehydrogenase-like predicted oxidoreductase